MNKFNSGDYIVTKDGFRGFVVTPESYCQNAYTIRLASGYAVYSGNDLRDRSFDVSRNDRRL